MKKYKNQNLTYFKRGCVITQFRWEVWLRFFFQKLRMSIRQVIWKFELNPSKGWGVIDIPREFPFWGGVGEEKGFGQKKNCFAFSGPSSNCLPILGSISPKKRTDAQMHRQTDRHFIALKEVINYWPNSHIFCKILREIQKNILFLVFRVGHHQGVMGVDFSHLTSWCTM